jgi:polyvinyl alcohol dehydrogenase (cytochrome)
MKSPYKVLVDVRAIFMALRPRSAPIFLMLLLFCCPLAAQEGGAIYKERCAACHDSPKERVPPLTAIKAMTGEAILATLKSGTMLVQAQGLSSAQLDALIAYIAPSGEAATSPTLSRTCQKDIPYRVAAETTDWNGWSPSETNSRFQSKAAAGLNTTEIPRLKLSWAFNLGSVTFARAQPTIVGGHLFITSNAGYVYSLDARNGCTYWSFKADAAIRSAATLGAARVYFADQSGTVYALDAKSGTMLWKVHPVDHMATMATAAPRYYGGLLYQPFASFEEVLGSSPHYDCCTSRGSVVALDAATGRTVWRTFTIEEAPHRVGTRADASQAYGPSGAGIWSTPTIDRMRGVLYVATGDNYSDPPSLTSDAVLAMDLKSGKLLWSQQFTANDAYNLACHGADQTHCPKARGPDFDFGQPPILVQLGGGARALVIAQKSGMAHALDPDRKGAVLWDTRLSGGGVLGGSEWGSAADTEKLYVATSDIVQKSASPDPKSAIGLRFSLDPMKGGGLHALDLKTGNIVWSAKPVQCAADRSDCSPAQSAAVTVIPGVVFSGSIDGHLRAYSSRTGEVLWDFDTEQDFPTVNAGPAHGGSIDVAGPTIVHGMLYVNSGYGEWGGKPGNVLLAFSIDGK